MATQRLVESPHQRSPANNNATETAQAETTSESASASASDLTASALKRTTAATSTTTETPPASGNSYRVIFPDHPQQQHVCEQYQPYSSQSNIPVAVLMGNALSQEATHHSNSNNQGQTHDHHHKRSHQHLSSQSHHQHPMHRNAASDFPEGMPLHQHQHHHQTDHQQPMPTQTAVPRSNLSALLEHQHPAPNDSARPVESRDPTATTACVCDFTSSPNTNTTTNAIHSTNSSPESKHDESDAASGPAPQFAPAVLLGSSAPSVITSVPSRRRRYSGPIFGSPPAALQQPQQPCVCGAEADQQQALSSQMPNANAKPFDVNGSKVRRCLSSKELGTLAPASGSPYFDMLNQREQLENQMTEKWSERRDSLALVESTPSTSPHQERAPIHHNSSNNDFSTTSSQQSASTSISRSAKAGSNENRNRRRAAHNRAVVEELCEIVADLFIAESKLINPSKYGVSRSLERDHVLKSVQKFVSALPTRYALGAETPSEVLLHMRLMSVARSDPTKCVVHFINLDNDSYWTGNGPGKGRSLRLVTISCSDATGLLEYITKLLGTGGSRVLDADVMLSADRIVLDRFVVEMNGRLRLDKLAQLIEAFLKAAREKAEHDREHQEDCSCQDGSLGNQSVTTSGPLYYNPNPKSNHNLVRRDVQEEISAAVPLTEVLASPNHNDAILDSQFETLKRHFSMPNEMACRGRALHSRQSSLNHILTPSLSSSQCGQPVTQRATHLHPRPVEASWETITDPALNDIHVEATDGQNIRQRRPLVNRRGASDLDRIGIEGESGPSIDFVTVPSQDVDGNLGVEARVVPLIPFDELMLIETVGMGRVSTIYRAAWQNPMGVQMVALKVAMVNPQTRDMAHVDELRREADIAARIKHPNVCDLVGVAADAECFCLAYDYCEGGSVLSLLSDTSRYYEYLPIALDVANGMAHLHSRDIIHRDLKPSNILLTRDHRAKIADFGMSVANAGQELTAETGTYRYMAPEVIRHESYSSNADVYSFGVFLWQLITRQVPFASMTPVQAAYAVAEGRRPEIPPSTPPRLKEIIEACWDQDSHRRPSFTYIAMALADYVKLSFSPASVGAQTLQIANDMLATVEGNSNINVDFTTPVPDPMYFTHGSDVGLEI